MCPRYPCLQQEPPARLGEHHCLGCWCKKQTGSINPVLLSQTCVAEPRKGSVNLTLQCELKIQPNGKGKGEGEGSKRWGCRCTALGPGVCGAGARGGSHVGFWAWAGSRPGFEPSQHSHPITAGRISTLTTHQVLLRI